MKYFILLSWLSAASLLVSQAGAFAVHQGCYVAISDGVRAFSFKAAATGNMTVESCR
jgi:hypothetical protein